MAALTLNCLLAMWHVLPSAEKQTLTLACHCATLKATRSFDGSFPMLLSAVHIALSTSYPFLLFLYKRALGL
jgi:hypothetical protein